MMSFFAQIYTLLAETDVAQKLAGVKSLVSDLEKDQPVEYAHNESVQPVTEPSYRKVCRIVHGSQVERRRNLNTTEGRAIFLHAIAHIEYSAIDLALDTAYRFRHLPPQYYEDWITVAADEARHFSMLRDLLRVIGHDYGDFPVHTGIYDAMRRSAPSMRMRMAATHRHLEAGGLDAQSELQRKMQLHTDTFTQKVLAALEIIYEDEISHVYAGDFWFRVACSLDGKNPSVFADDVAAAIPGAKLLKKNINYEARRRAGFTDEEIRALTVP